VQKQRRLCKPSHPRACAPNPTCPFPNQNPDVSQTTTCQAPRDKLVCILNCCRVIGNMLHTGPRSSGDGSAAGADDFTPLLIMSVIRARPPRLGSNIAYIERYRMRSKMSGEAAYYFVQLVRCTWMGGWMGWLGGWVGWVDAQWNVGCIQAHTH